MSPPLTEQGTVPLLGFTQSGGRGGLRTSRRAGWAGPAPSPEDDSREGLRAEGTP